LDMGCCNPLHFLPCTHFLHTPQFIEFEPTPFPHTPHGDLPCGLTTASAFLAKRMILVLAMFTRSPIVSNASFHFSSCSCRVTFSSAVIPRSSANNISQGALRLISFVASSITLMKSSGLRTEPWCTLLRLQTVLPFWFLRLLLYALQIQNLGTASVLLLPIAHQLPVGEAPTRSPTSALGRMPFPSLQMQPTAPYSSPGVFQSTFSLRRWHPSYIYRA